MAEAQGLDPPVFANAEDLIAFLNDQPRESLPSLLPMSRRLSGEDMRAAFLNNGNPRYRGLHAQIELKGADVALLNSKEFVSKFLLDLCDFIDMKPFLDPAVHEFGEGRLHGVTGNLFLYTSNECAHCWPFDRGLSLDVYSCAVYDPYTAAEFCRNYFHARGYEMQVCLRVVILDD